MVVSKYRWLAPNETGVDIYAWNWVSSAKKRWRKRDIVDVFFLNCIIFFSYIFSTNINTTRKYTQTLMHIQTCLLAGRQAVRCVCVFPGISSYNHNHHNNFVLKRYCKILVCNKMKQAKWREGKKSKSATCHPNIRVAVIGDWCLLPFFCF